MECLLTLLLQTNLYYNTLVVTVTAPGRVGPGYRA